MLGTLYGDETGTAGGPNFAAPHLRHSHAPPEGADFGETSRQEIVAQERVPRKEAMMDFPLDEIEVVTVRVLARPNPIDYLDEGELSDELLEASLAEIVTIAPLGDGSQVLRRDEIKGIVGQSWAGHSTMRTSVDTEHLGADGPIWLNITVELLGSVGAMAVSKIVTSIAEAVLKKLRCPEDALAEGRQFMAGIETARVDVAGLAGVPVADIQLVDARKEGTCQEFLFKNTITGSAFRYRVEPRDCRISVEKDGGSAVG